MKHETCVDSGTRSVTWKTFDVQTINRIIQERMRGKSFDSFVKHVVYYTLTMPIYVSTYFLRHYASDGPTIIAVGKVNLVAMYNTNTIRHDTINTICSDV